MTSPQKQAVQCSVLTKRASSLTASSTQPSITGKSPAGCKALRRQFLITTKELYLTCPTKSPTASKAYSLSSTEEAIPARAPLPPAAPVLLDVASSGDGVEAMRARCGCRLCRDKKTGPASWDVNIEGWSPAPTRRSL